MAESQNALERDLTMDPNIVVGGSIQIKPSLRTFSSSHFFSTNPWRIGGFFSRKLTAKGTQMTHLNKPAMAGDTPVMQLS